MVKNLLKALLNTDRLADYLALCKLTLSEDGKPPEWVELVPPGKVVALDGRKFNNSKPQAVVDKFNANTLDLPIDWEHSSEIKAPEGDEAPAAGWINKLEVREGSIWGRVEWTERGTASLISKEYRYISPAFMHTKTGVVTELVSVGLTNKPALDQLAAVAHAKPGTGENIMDPKILAALGLSPTATDAEVLVAIQSRGADGEKMAKELIASREQLTSTKEQLATASAKTPELDKFVPRADHDAMTARVKVAEDKLVANEKSTKDNEIAGEIAAALKVGKITPATSDYHKAQCAQEGGLERFREYVKTAPVIGDPSDLAAASPPGKGVKKATVEQLAIAARCGVSEEEYLASL